MGWLASAEDIFNWAEHLHNRVYVFQTEMLDRKCDAQRSTLRGAFLRFPLSSCFIHSSLP